MNKNRQVLLGLIGVVALLGWLVFVDASHQTIAYDACESITVGADQTTLAQLTEQFPVEDRTTDTDLLRFEASRFFPAVTHYTCEVEVKNGKITNRYLVEDAWF